MKLATALIATVLVSGIAHASDDTMTAKCSISSFAFGDDCENVEPGEKCIPSPKTIEKVVTLKDNDKNSDGSVLDGVIFKAKGVTVKARYSYLRLDRGFSINASFGKNIWASSKEQLQVGVRDSRGNSESYGVFCRLDGQDE
jgi:hypothetical protein